MTVVLSTCVLPSLNPWMTFHSCTYMRNNVKCCSKSITILKPTTLSTKKATTALFCLWGFSTRAPFMLPKWKKKCACGFFRSSNKQMLIASGLLLLSSTAQKCLVAGGGVGRGLGKVKYPSQVSSTNLFFQLQEQGTELQNG